MPFPENLSCAACASRDCGYRDNDEGGDDGTSLVKLDFDEVVENRAVRIEPFSPKQGARTEPFSPKQPMQSLGGLKDLDISMKPLGQIAWADLNGPPSARKGRGRGDNAPLVSPRLQSPHVRVRSPSPSINPFTGFMSMSVAACEYVALRSDPVDCEVKRSLTSLPYPVAAAIILRRLAQGKYEIEGTHVSVYHDARSRELVAAEVAAGPGGLAVPLLAYLNQVAKIAMQIRPASAPRTLTFAEKGVSKPLNLTDSDDRFEAMRMALEQARMRGVTAEQYEKQTAQTNPQAFAAPPAMSPFR